MRPKIWQDENGIVYLQVDESRFVVNNGTGVVFVDVDLTKITVTAIDNKYIVQTVNRLLHPLSGCVSVDPVVQGILLQISKEEAEMAKKATAEAAVAEVPAKKAKFAPAGNGKAPAAKAAAPAGEVQDAVELKNNALYQTKVVATEKGKEAREGSFFRKLHDLAQKPIKLGDLIDQVIESDFALKSEKDRDMVIRVRARDAFTRLGYLQEATK